MHIRVSRVFFLPLYWLSFVAFSAACAAQSNSLTLNIKDADGRPVPQVVVGIQGTVESAVSDGDGSAKVRLSDGLKESAWLKLVIQQVPHGDTFVLLGPLQGWIQVPDHAEDVARIVVVKKGDTSILKDAAILSNALTEIDLVNSVRAAGVLRPEMPEAKLNAIATKYGVSPKSLDRAIRKLGAETPDSYEKGMAALYAGDYAQAAGNLQKALGPTDKNTVVIAGNLDRCSTASPAPAQ